MRILIADDNEAVRKGVCSILQSRYDMEVCGEASAGQEAVVKAQVLKPDLVILDVSLPDSSGLDVAMRVRESLPEVPILLLTAHGSPMIDEIRKRGLQGYVSKVRGGHNFARGHRCYSPFQGELLCYQLVCHARS